MLYSFVSKNIARSLEGITGRNIFLRLMNGIPNMKEMKVYSPGEVIYSRTLVT